MAVVLGDIATSLIYSVAQIRTATQRGDYGQTRITKEFRLPGVDAMSVCREANSRRRKCDILYLNRLDEDSI